MLVNARVRLSVFRRLLAGTGTGEDIIFFEKDIPRQNIHSDLGNEDLQGILGRLKAKGLTEEDKEYLQLLISRERANVHNGREQQERNRRSGIKY